FPDLPPFPENVPTAPLLRIDLAKLLAHDAEEEERCWEACCDLGFFYLDLRAPAPSEQAIDGEALLRDADSLFTVMKSFFSLSVAEKLKYDFAAQGSYFGYKGYGAGFIDKAGTRDQNEFYNISKDDILSISPPLPSPAVLNPHRALYAAYIHRCHAICTLLTSLLTSRLPLTPPAFAAGGLTALHPLSSASGDQIRFVKALPQAADQARVALGEHTDFGSVTVLFNRLGGLQVRLPSSISPVPPSVEPMAAAERALCADGWTYVRPLPGHAVVNLGDALVKFSGGRLRSNVHRVVGPPGQQGKETRYSLVYFCRPGDEVRLRSLVESVGEGDEDGEGATAKEWILRRALQRRKVDGWEKSGGTEGQSMR
ncbi:Clavaminate synthase-like protein, partial [Polyplosphaeria fusca]